MKHASNRIDHHPGYILHTQPYRETSLLLDVLTAQYGRQSILARGARRARADLRGVLLPFQPLTLSWFGTNEVKTLHRAHWIGGVPQLSGIALLSGFYINELMVKLTAKNDPDPQLFALYDETIRQISQPVSLPPVLRHYEYRLLKTLGHAPDLSHDHHDQPIQADHAYICYNKSVPQRDSGQPLHGECVPISGHSLLAITAEDYRDATTRTEAKALFQLWLADALGHSPLASRRLLHALTLSTDTTLASD